MGFILPKQSSSITNSAPANTVPVSNGTNLVDGDTLASVTISNPTTINIDSKGGNTLIGDIHDTDTGIKLKVNNAENAVQVLGGAFVVANGRIFSSDGLSPLAEGVGSVGDVADPFLSAYFGASSTANVRVVSAASALRTATLPDATGTVLLDTLFNLSKTVTAGGTTGAQTINKPAGSVNFAAAATSLVVTNSLVTTSSVILCTVATNDTTLKSVQCVAGSGSFTIFGSAAATAETRVNFVVIN